MTYETWVKFNNKEWTVNIQLADGRNVTLDMSALVDVWVLVAPDSQGRFPIGVYFSEEAAIDAREELLKDSINEDAKAEDPFRVFNIKKVSMEPLSQLIRHLAGSAGSLKYVASIQDRNMGEYDLICNRDGRLYRHPRGRSVPAGWVKVSEDSLLYEGRLISLLWMLPIFKE